MAGFVNSFPATQRIIYETKFKHRFRDKSILPLITNDEHKGDFRNMGTEIDIPVLPLIQTFKTTPGADIQYQDLKGTYEKFTIGRERYFAFRLTEEDKMYSAISLDSAFKEEGTRQSVSDTEAEFLSDVPFKCHEFNQGNEAGLTSASYKLGDAATPITLFKCREDSVAASGVSEKNLAPDYLISCINALNEMPGGLDSQPWIIVPVAVANILQTSEMKRADWMGDSESVLRRGVRFLGNLNGCNVIVNNQLPVWRGATPAQTKYLIFFGDSSAVTFLNEANIDDKLTSDRRWGFFYRSKFIYDWYVKYPERIGMGMVKIGG